MVCIQCFFFCFCDYLLTTSSTTGLDWCTRIDFDITSSRLSRSWAHSILYFCSHCHKGLLNICCILCTCFQERNRKRVCIFLWSKKEQTQFTSTTHSLHSLLVYRKACFSKNLSKAFRLPSSKLKTLKLTQ